MPILERYRKRSARVTTGYRRVLILVILLGVVVALMGLLARTGRQRSPDTKAPESQMSSLPRADPASTAHADETRTSRPKWRPLPPEKERALLAKLADQVPLRAPLHHEAYYYLLNKVQNMTDAELEKDLDTTVAYADCARRPKEIRGRVVEVSGTLLRLERTPLNLSKAGLSAVYEGQIMDRDQHIYSFFLSEPPQPSLVPGDVRVRDSRRVRLRGVFMQVLVYENREDPPKHVATPLIIGRRLVEIRKRRPGPGRIGWQWIVSLAVLTLAVGFWLFLRLPQRARRRR